MQQRRFCLALAFAAILASPCATGITTAADRPNILWITSEDNGPNLGCYGDPSAATPRLDELASRSLRFLHCSSNAPVCAPARTTSHLTTPTPREFDKTEHNPMTASPCSISRLATISTNLRQTSSTVKPSSSTGPTTGPACRGTRGRRTTPASTSRSSSMSRKNGNISRQKAMRPSSTSVYASLLAVIAFDELGEKGRPFAEKLRSLGYRGDRAAPARAQGYAAMVMEKALADLGISDANPKRPPSSHDAP